LIGNIILFLNHKKIIPIIFGIASPALIFFVFYISFHPYYLYVGLLGLVIASILNYIENKRCPKCV